MRDVAVADFELSEEGSRQAITAVLGPGGRLVYRDAHGRS